MTGLEKWNKNENQQDSHTSCAMARRNDAAAPAFLHQSHGPAFAAAGLDVDVHLSRLVDCGGGNGRWAGGHWQCRTGSAGDQAGDRSISDRKSVVQGKRVEL